MENKPSLFLNPLIWNVFEMEDFTPPYISVSQVYLDISFAFDPEVELPLVIMPLGFASHQSGAVAGLHPGGFSGAPSYNDFPPPGYPQSYPGQQASSSGYSSQWPQQVPQYGFASAAYPPSMGQHYGPTAPPTFQQEGQTPSYPSLYPSI